MKRRRIEVNLKELDQVLEGARQAPLTDPDYEKLKTALHALGDALTPTRTTEKTHPVLGKKDERSSQEKAESKGTEAQSSGAKAAGHGRNGSAAFESAQKVETKHRQLKPGDGCPECPTGKVYAQKEPRTLIRVVGQAPIQATVHELERLRGNLCGQVFTAEPPEGVGPEKYDETVASMGKATGFSILPGRGDSAG
jgi:transposase